MTAIGKQDIDYDFIKRYLVHGEVKSLAVESGIKPDTGYKILQGRTWNPEFLMKCYARALERANEFLKAREQQRILEQKISML